MGIDGENWGGCRAVIEEDDSFLDGTEGDERV